MKKTIALFLYDPKCSVQSGNGIMKALENHYNFKIFSRARTEDNFFDDVDMIAVPGGFGDASSFKKLFENNKNQVVDFVDNGGAYLGICMGAYWAGSRYFNILDSVDAEQYLTRPGSDTRRPHAKNINISWQGDPMQMFWYDGCSFTGNTHKFKTVARYSGNNDSMAIIQKRIGLIGCHPESDEFWYNSYSWLKGKYHNGLHHKLLLEFVDQIIK